MEPKSAAPGEAAINSIAELHVEAMMNASPAQLRIERFTRAIGRPRSAVLAVLVTIAWVAANLLLLSHGGRSFDSPQFPYLQLLLSLASLLTTLLIVISENRMSDLAERRAQITLQIALLAEEKTAKVIAILEEMRRDDPHLPNRRDPEAERMAEATDLRDTVERLQTAQERAFTDRS